MKDLKPNNQGTRPMRNANPKHPWMGLTVPSAKASTIRAQLPVIYRPILEGDRATGPRGI